MGVSGTVTSPNRLPAGSMPAVRRIPLLPLLVAVAGFASPALAQRSRPSSIRSAAPVTVRTQTADQQVLQVLNRLAFGPRPGDAAVVRKMGVDAWVDQQLHPERIDDSGMDQVMAAYPLLGEDQAKLAASYAAAQRARRQLKRTNVPDSATGTSAKPAIPPELREAQRQRNELAAQLASSRVARAVSSNRQLLEVMTDFWENHFSVYARKNAIEPYYLADYDRTIREHALGKFRDLLGAVAHSPAMLVYLDNALSRANPGEPTLAPNGPAAGRGPLAAFRPNGPTAGDVDAIIQRRQLNPTQAARLRARFAQYQARVKQGAKRSGGLNENYGRELMELHTLGVNGGYTQHDVIDVARALTGWGVRPPAQGGGFIFRPQWHDAGEKTILGQHFPAGHGEDEGERVLDMIARSPATAHFISQELCERFVSDSPSTALVDRAAQTFLRSDGDMREVVRTIVTSPEFFSAQAYHAKVKSPFEVVVSAARALGAQPDTTARTAFAVSYLGEPLFGHEEPNGWPETGESWMNTGGILNRINFGMAVAANRLPGTTISGVPGADSLEHAPRAEQVDGVVAAILGGAASPDTRRILESGEHPLAAAAARQGASNASDSMNSRMTGGMQVVSPNGAAMPPVKAKGNTKQGGLLGARGAGKNAIVGAVPRLDGFAQVVGLALGSPEFQRR